MNVFVIKRYHSCKLEGKIYLQTFQLFQTLYHFLCVCKYRIQDMTMRDFKFRIQIKTLTNKSIYI